MKLNIIYRISESGYQKVKPWYINNKNCFLNAINIFSPNVYNWLVIADNVSLETKKYLLEFLKEEFILETSIGNGAGTFNVALDTALRYNKTESVYFLENDYLHKKDSDKILIEGLESGNHYVSLYDHPDKYIAPSKGGNPFIGEDGYELTKVFTTNSSHWKLTNSTTMTFASKVQTLEEDKSTIRKWTNGNHPHDFNMFLELLQKNRKIITPIPGYSTHGETAWLSKFTDWEKV